MRASKLILGAALLALATVPAACRKAPPADPIPEHETFRLASTVLGEERVINVHLPPAYAERPEQAFPILYMPDGGIGEDFPHIVNTLAALEAAGEVVPLIVVGIENTQRRRDMTGPTDVAKDREIAPVVGGSAAFRSFIRDELMPEVGRRYRDNGETGIVGEAPAGLAWTYLPRRDLRHDTIYRAVSGLAFRQVFAPD